MSTSPDIQFRKLTNVNWRLSQWWENLHLALLYLLPLLVSTMELVFLIQVKKHRTFCKAVLVSLMDHVFPTQVKCNLLRVKSLHFFKTLYFLIQPHHSSWCSLVLPYVQVNKLVLVNQWKKLGNVSPAAPLLGRPPPPHPDPRPLHLPPRQHLLGSHSTTSLKQVSLNMKIFCSGRQISRRRSSCAPNNALAGPQPDRRQVIKVKFIQKRENYDFLSLIYLLICQNLRAAKTTMLMMTILLVCYLPLIIKWQVESMECYGVQRGV